MYRKCIVCEKFGRKCDGPNFLTMPSEKLLLWCKAYKEHRGWSNLHLSQISGVPKGTIDRLFSGDHTDYKFETIRFIVLALIKGDGDSNFNVGEYPCPVADDPVDSGEIKLITKDLEHTKALLEAAQRDAAYVREMLTEIKAVARRRRIISITLALFLGALIILEVMLPAIGLIRW